MTERRYHRERMPTDSTSDESRPATRLVLVRHALTGTTGSVLTGRAPGVHLSEEGWAQAKALAERLADLPVAAVYASPVERAQETAEAIAAPHDLPVGPLPAVTEVDYGEWTGKKLDELKDTGLWRIVQALPSSARFPGGEAIRDLQHRAVSALDGVVSDHAGELVVVVSHADVIKAAVAHYAGLHLDAFQRLVVGPASVSVVAFFGPFPALVRLNDTGTLDDLAGPGPSRGASDGAGGS